MEPKPIPIPGNETTRQSDVTAPAPKASEREIYRCTEVYDHKEDFSCCFRQWRATHSHCKYIHGYALGFSLTFAMENTDKYKWRQDSGTTKAISEWLKSMFDHTTLVAQDDPELPKFELLALDGLIDLRVLAAVGCEAIGKYVHDRLTRILQERTGGKVWLESVEVKEHGGNSGIYHL